MRNEEQGELEFAPRDERHTQLYSSKVTETSRKAYLSMVKTGELSRNRMAVYESLLVDGDQTGRELNDRLNSQSAHKRLSELHKLGFIEPLPPRECRITGRIVTAWRAIVKEAQ